MRWLLRVLRWVLSSVELEGRRLDADLRALLFLANRRRSIETWPAAEARARALEGQKLIPKPRVRVHAIEDLQGAGLSLRRYQPGPEPSDAGLLFYHGGGFVIGGLDSHDHLCRTLAKEGNCEVIAVDYRLAPEHPFPAAVDDALKAWTWFRQQPYSRHLVGGDSAGGNLAAVVCQQAPEKPDGQLLIYPIVDRLTASSSRKIFAEGFLYTESMANWFKNHYLPADIDHQDERINPMLRADLSDLPPAYVLLAGFDMLHDEGLAYAEKLRAAGVEVVVQLEDSLIHGFTSLVGACPAAIRACQEAGRGLRSLGTSSD